MLQMRPELCQGTGISGRAVTNVDGFIRNVASLVETANSVTDKDIHLLLGLIASDCRATLYSCQILSPRKRLFMSIPWPRYLISTKEKSHATKKTHPSDYHTTP